MCLTPIFHVARLFQAHGSEGIEVGASDGDPTVFGAFDFDVLEGWRCSAFADRFGATSKSSQTVWRLQRVDGRLKIVFETEFIH